MFQATSKMLKPLSTMDEVSDSESVFAPSSPNWAADISPICWWKSSTLALLLDAELLVAKFLSRRLEATLDLARLHCLRLLDLRPPPPPSPLNAAKASEGSNWGGRVLVLDTDDKIGLSQH